VLGVGTVTDGEGPDIVVASPGPLPGERTAGASFGKSLGMGAYVRTSDRSPDASVMTAMMSATPAAAGRTPHQTHEAAVDDGAGVAIAVTTRASHPAVGWTGCRADGMAAARLR
jgi:hypothetical protein